jgi:hypothetical protein
MNGQHAAQTDGAQMAFAGLIADEAALDEIKANVKARMDEQRRVEDLDIEAHNDGSFRLISLQCYNRQDNLNLPAYRYSHVITVRWEDADGRLAESFDGWASTPEAAQTEAQRKYAAWLDRMDQISAWTFQRSAVC